MGIQLSSNLWVGVGFLKDPTLRTRGGYGGVLLCEKVDSSRIWRVAIAIDDLRTAEIHHRGF